LLLGSTLYGTTGNGGAGTPYFGTVFKINTDGTGFATVCSLTGNAGWGPQGGLVLSGGTFYGTTVNGGILPEVFAFADGTVFSVDINGSGLTDLCVFTEASGAADPWTALALSGNTLYGTTLYGGTNNNGTLFEINTNGSGYAEIKDFSADGFRRRPIPMERIHGRPWFCPAARFMARPDTVARADLDRYSR
jgi:uncharacterized repeat protein (TIGR03803 family)